MQNQWTSKGFFVGVLILIFIVLGYVLFNSFKVEDKNLENPSLKENLDITDSNKSVTDTQEDAILEQNNNLLEVYIDPEKRFSFSYSKELGELRLNDDVLYFSETHDEFSSTVLSIFTNNYEKTNKDYISSQDVNSTGDYNPFINGNGWKSEKVLIESSKDGYINCLNNEQGVFRAVLCEIKTIGENKFLIKYSRDTYKGDSTIKQYIVYNKDIRYEFGGGKGLVYSSYFSCEDYPNHSKCGIQDGVELYTSATTSNLKNHALNKYEILIEDMLKTLTFK